MPCFDGQRDRCNNSSYYEDKLQKAEAENQNLSTLLCSACQMLELFNYNFKTNPLLDEWNFEHRIRDNLRYQEEMYEHLGKMRKDNPPEFKKIKERLKEITEVKDGF